ncbi:MAG: AmmeMemoRadiSam system protein B, partial [Acidobacteriota bacterium]
MSEFLPRLRTALDIMPSPSPDRPGIVLRDPLGYADDMLIIPPSWVPALACLDGRHTEREVQAELTRQATLEGRGLVFLEDLRQFVGLLNSRGFLETEELTRRRERRQAEFRSQQERRPVHVGMAYPEDAGDLRRTFEPHFSGPSQSEETPEQPLLGLAAPHVSPDGGWRSYAAAYRQVNASLQERTFVILGTSHYGEPEKFGLTRKPFITPLGKAVIDEDGVEFLAQRASQGVIEEDYCHAVEHSVEFQVLFLQYRLGAPVRILPILCGPFAESLTTRGRRPEDNPGVGRFLEALAELARHRRGSVFWLLGVDLAHIGVRYGDAFAVRAGEGRMIQVETQDRRRL